MGVMVSKAAYRINNTEEQQARENKVEQRPQKETKSSAGEAQAAAGNSWKTVLLIEAS